MPNALVFIIIIAVLGGLYFGQISEKNGGELEGLSPEASKEISQKKPLIKSPTYIETTKPSNLVPAVKVDTFISSGPKEGEVLNDTNEVTFKFKASVSSKEEVKERIIFETKVEGFDKDWQTVYYEERKVSFPPGPKEYTFLVRAKVGRVIDETPAKRGFKINTSPYFGKVTISSRGSTGVSLYNRLQKEETINITGWKVGGNKGNIIIPQGIEMYLPYEENSLSDIILRPYDVVYIWSSSNPLGPNKSFKPNKCFGFLADQKDLKLPISSSKKCPQIKLEDISYLSENCQNFILQRMRGCQTPDYSKELTIIYDSNCRSYIDNYVAENLNYTGCFENYYQDDNFLEKSWHIFTGREIANRYHDVLYIYDREGLVVYKYLY